MTVQWHDDSRPHLGVQSLSGYLGADAVARFTGAVGRTLARGEGSLILDVHDLHGSSPQGRTAVIDAARGLAVRRLAAQGRPLEVAGLPPPTARSP